MEKEGVIKYQLDFRRVPVTIPASVLSGINPCRDQLKGLALVGQDPSRYGGLGYGNISVRCSAQDNAPAFYITASQTGHLDELDNSDICLVTDFDIHRNMLAAQGDRRPSSESLSHGALYRANTKISAVIHVHSPNIWHAPHIGDAIYIAKAIPYGTPAMAQALSNAAQNDLKSSKPLTIVMQGHEDGVICAGQDLEHFYLVL